MSTSARSAGAVLGAVGIVLVLAIALGSMIAAPWWMPAWASGPMWGAWLILAVVLGVLGLVLGLTAGVVGVAFGLVIAVFGVAIGLALPLAPIALVVIVVWLLTRSRTPRAGDLAGGDGR